MGKVQPIRVKAILEIREKKDEVANQETKKLLKADGLHSYKHQDHILVHYSLGSDTEAGWGEGAGSDGSGGIYFRTGLSDMGGKFWS